jgi:DNA (cytosine-5)-methyltransferase 1
MTHGSLFSGIGGFDLAAHWMGWHNTFHCEWNPFGQKVLKHHFPNSISYNDITKTDFSIHEGRIDILTGGFPCQPYSTAGLRKGKADERHLFPEMLRAIKEIKPRWVIGENVRGLVSWNGGMVFNEVCDDLEREGYEVQPFLIPAAGVNAPHQRQRIWFVAYSNNKGRSGEFSEVQKENGEISQRNNDAESSNASDANATNTQGIRSSVGKLGESEKRQQIQTRSNIDRFNDLENASNSISIRLEHSEEGRNIYQSTGKTQSERSKSSESFETNGFNGNVTNSTSNGGKQDNRIRKSRFFNQTSKTNEWENFPTQSPICGGDDGIPRELDSITFSKWRNESIKGYGNAIVPQVAYEIFKTIEKFENSL